jgi:predicted AAA+ superfamily ATPase
MMAGQEILDYLIADFHNRPLPEFTPRQIRLPCLPQKADALIGMRRSGKTYTLYQEMSRLLSEGVSKNAMLFVNFEDDRLQPLTSDVLGNALEAFYRRYPSSRADLAYLFLDEIHNVPDWQRFVRRVLDTERVQVYITGSSARLLSREIATALRGRSLSVEVPPFNFAEALAHARVEVPETFPPGAHLRSQLERRLEEYLTQGGFPEVQGVDPRDRIRVLQEYMDVVILRDVVERHDIGNVEVLRYLVRSLFGSVGQPFSVNKFLNDLKSQGTPVAKDTLHAYLAHLLDAFLVFLVPIDRASARARQVNPRKVYAVDVGLAGAQVWLGTAARGRMLENLVYLELRRRASESGTVEGIAYYLTADRREVDFVVGTAPGPEGASGRRLLQVCADLTDPETRSREIGSLRAAMSETGLREATVVTLHQEETLSTSEGTICVVPAWRWALEKSP